MKRDDPERRPLGGTDITVSPVALGCWPIAGVTTLDTNEADSIATIQACFDLGINHLDTAYVYGPRGESETLVGRAVAGRRDEMVIATKCGIHYEGSAMENDGRPERLRAECDESLRRLGTDHVELLYFHAPDENVPIEESAGALLALMQEGKTRSVGASNCTIEQLEAFSGVCPLTAVQMPYNMLQRDIERRTIPWCRERNIAVMVYWPLMKGILAGRLPRDHQFHDRDSRRNYPMYHGDEWQKNQDFVERLRVAASLRDADSVVRGSPDPAHTVTVAQLVINWTINQPGITSALCGAKRRWQIEELAGAMGWTLSGAQLAMIDAALAKRGAAVAKRVFT
ncbi:MAG TPA: aldo/keto reductase [Lacipirellulaceae bacterium]|jgi:aryl-alcohol dehydrogenase-like predicted oxidoreductase|nr:aldo/keto reductase [Lacipirellulaceae bacterium]